MYERIEKPNFLVYTAYLLVYGIAINTVYLVLPNDAIKWYLLGILVIGVMSGYILSSRHYVTIGLLLDIAGLVVFSYYGWRIYNDKLAFGTYLGEMLSVMMVLRCFKLYRYQDFLLPLVISLTLMVFSAIPSFSADFVYSLLGFLLLLGLAMFLGSVDEFAKLPGKRARRSALRYTYDFLEEYMPVANSQRSPVQLLKLIGPAIRASVPAVLFSFMLSSALYFTVDHTVTPGSDSPFLGAFGDAGFESDPNRESELLTGIVTGGRAQYYTGFDTEFNISQGRLIENSTSTQVVMEVESNLPSYWRGKCFDSYTGRGWVQSPDALIATWSLDPPAGRRNQYHGEIDSEVESQGITPDPELYKDEIRQTFRLKTTLPGIVFTAYQPVELSMPVPAVQIDDMFTIYPPPSADSMVSGQHYEVVSRKHFAQGAYLNAYDYNPRDLSQDEPDFYKRYTSLPERGSMEDPAAGFNFTRIRAKAYEITAGSKTIFDKVSALDRYLETDFNYSLNPPSAVPPEQDAVDYFLFDWDAKRGHCEYFSTSLAVLCRSIGIPARVVTGYATGNFNILKNRYIVQERHAHAWVEIFWPEIGWVEFDPTPQSWFQGFGERAAGGWLLFHNAMESLYIYDPRGYIRDKIIPSITLLGGRVKYFLNQRELDFIETTYPLAHETRTDRIQWIALLYSLIAGLIASFILRIWLDPNRNHKTALVLGRRCLNKIKKSLVINGVDADDLATEKDLAIRASGFSNEWGMSVGRVVDLYQNARYSGTKVSSGDLALLRGACRTALRIPVRYR